jgi:hypothetical protein
LESPKRSSAFSATALKSRDTLWSTVAKAQTMFARYCAVCSTERPQISSPLSQRAEAHFGRLWQSPNNGRKFSALTLSRRSSTFSVTASRSRGTLWLAVAKAQTMFASLSRLIPSDRSETTAPPYRRAY